MDDRNKSVEDWIGEAEALHSRLDEAEETLRAIREGEVDSLLISTPQGDKVYVLEGADRPYRILVESMQHGAATLLANGEFFYSNQYLASLLKTNLERLIGASFHKFVHSEDAALFAQLFDQARVHSSSMGDLRLKAADDTTIPVHLACTCITLGERIGLCLAVTDLSTVVAAQRLAQANDELHREVAARKRAEEALRTLNESLEQRVDERTADARSLADQLRSLAVELSQTEQRERMRLAGILHDHIQQLLVAGQMQVEWIKRASNPERIQNAAQSTGAILKEAIAASRSLSIDLSPPILREVGLAGGLNWLVGRMKEKYQFAVSLRTDTRAEPASKDTAILLFECVRELLFNAAKHAGVLQAEVTLLRTKDNSIRIIVSDAGEGFDPHRLHKRSPNEATFGLFSIQQRLAHIGGQVEIESSPKKGTTVRLIVPSGESGPATEQTFMQEPQEKISTHSKDETRRILIVDDHKIVREGLCGLFQFETGLEVVGDAANGLQAIALAQQLAPDVIIMDVNMDEMNGVEATRQILAGNPHIRIIGLSMHNDNSVAEAMRAAGAVAYLTKGGPSEDLIALVRGACEPVR